MTAMHGIIVCPHCGAKVGARHQRCPRCRARFEQVPASPSERRRVMPYAMTVLAIAGGIAAYSFSRQASAPHARLVLPAASAATSQPAPPPAQPAPADEREDQGIPFLEPGRAGNSAYGAGEYSRALDAYRAAVQKNPDDAESWSNMGQVLVRLGRVDESLPAFERAIQLNRDRWAYHFNLARAYGLLGQWQVAVNEYRESQRLYPEDYAIAFNLGLALRNAGDAGGAVEQLEKAAALSPEDASFHLALARTYEQLGRKQDAVAAYQQTLTLAPDATEAPAIRARIDALVK